MGWVSPRGFREKARGAWNRWIFGNTRARAGAEGKEAAARRIKLVSITVPLQGQTFNIHPTTPSQVAGAMTEILNAYGKDVNNIFGKRKK